MNCKGTILDALGLIIIAIFLVVFIIALFIATKETDDSLREVNLTSIIPNYDAARQPIIDQAARYPAFMDFVFVFLLFGMWFAIMIAAFLLGNNPLFLVIYIVTSFVLILTALVLEFGMENFVNNDLILPYAINFPMIVSIVNNFIFFSLFFIVTVAIALYLKPGSVTQ